MKGVSFCISVALILLPACSDDEGTKPASDATPPAQVQDLGDIVPKLLEIKAKAGTLIRFHIRIEVGDGKTIPAAEVAKDFNALLKRVDEDLELR